MFISCQHFKCFTPLSSCLRVSEEKSDVIFIFCPLDLRWLFLGFLPLSQWTKKKKKKREIFLRYSLWELGRPPGSKIHRSLGIPLLLGSLEFLTPRLSILNLQQFIDHSSGFAISRYSHIGFCLLVSAPVSCDSLYLLFFFFFSNLGAVICSVISLICWLWEVLLHSYMPCWTDNILGRKFSSIKYQIRFEFIKYCLPQYLIWIWIWHHEIMFRRPTWIAFLLEFEDQSATGP